MKVFTCQIKFINSLVLLILTLGAAGCATTIPETDTVAPQIRLTINGPVVGRQEMTNPPQDNWTGPGGVQLFNLAENTEYGFLLTVSDQGGVARANLRMPDSFVITDLSPSSAVSIVAGISRSLTLTGLRTSPTTGLVISGRFRTPALGGEVILIDFQTEGDDFGGSTGPTNRRFMDVSASVQSPE